VHRLPCTRRRKFCRGLHFFSPAQALPGCFTEFPRICRRLTSFFGQPTLHYEAPLWSPTLTACRMAPVCCNGALIVFLPDGRFVAGLYIFMDVLAAQVCHSFAAESILTLSAPGAQNWRCTELPSVPPPLPSLHHAWGTPQHDDAPFVPRAYGFFTYERAGCRSILHLFLSYAVLFFPLPFEVFYRQYFADSGLFFPQYVFPSVQL